MVNYAQHFNVLETPQLQPIPGSTQVENSAGGFSFAVDDWVRLDRFLVLGNDGGSYYASARKMTIKNAEAVLRCIHADGPRVVARTREISEAGRAPKNDPALFVLAMCAGLGDPLTKSAALDALPRVARIGTHLLHFAEYVQGFRGWGRGLRRAIAAWYEQKEAATLTFQTVKYQQRDKWSHRDLLRLSHPKTAALAHKQVFEWICRGTVKLPALDELSPELGVIAGFEQAKTAEEKTLVGLIEKHCLPLEAVPTEKRTRKVWEALIPTLGLTALIRNLGNLSKAGVLAKGQWSAVEQVTQRLTDTDQLKKARIHPIAVLAALLTYQQGHGMRGKGEWGIVPEVVDALDRAFYLSFQVVEPTGKRIVLALDVSGSMDSGEVAGIPGLTPRQASAAMAMVNYKTEKQLALVTFSHEMVPVDISRCQRLDTVVRGLKDIPMGGTDCALPMLWALKNNMQADAFVIYTDSETWAGRIHPIQALQRYRQKTGIGAKLIVVGMVANEFSIADPRDAGMLDCVGFDTATPQVISQFIA